MKYMSFSATKNALQKITLILAIVSLSLVFFNISLSSGISVLPDRAVAMGDFTIDLSYLNIPTTPTPTTPTPTPVDDSVITVTTNCNGGHCWNNQSTADKVCQMNAYDYAGSYLTTTAKLTNRFCSWATSSGGWWSCDYSCSSCSVSISSVSCENNAVLPPAAPTLTSSGEGIVNVSSVTLIMVSTDPQGYGIRYQIDEDADGTIDFYIPQSGFIPSGTTQEVVQPNIAPGSYPVRVRAENDQGLVSAWSANTITVSIVEPDPPVVIQFCTY
ncbi:hypothetical protein JXR01_03760 [Candidatus Kaiserbacteria bacterium]|nr:MAG: hypothetical protein JXR01_03760 [Candidatus Kaiserbacteria bacterium]